MQHQVFEVPSSSVKHTFRADNDLSVLCSFYSCQENFRGQKITLKRLELFRTEYGLNAHSDLLFSIINNLDIMMSRSDTYTTVSSCIGVVFDLIRG